MNTEPNKRSINQPKSNPLSKFFRTPSIYFNLPSNGEFWEPGSLDMPENGELAVYPMTNRDEIMIRTPDALLNGTGVVEVIQSCVPGIKDAWKMPACDVDAVLVAMRIASYGHSMDFNNRCPHCQAEHDYAIDLRHLLGSIKIPNYNEPLDLDVVRIKFRPQKYWEVNFANKTTYEIRKLNQSLESIGPATEENEETITIITEQLMRVNKINQRIMAASTESIEIMESGEVVSDTAFIEDFYASIDRRMFDTIQNTITSIQEQGAVKPVETNCQTCEKPMEIVILFDYANFFVAGS
jgi:hypothetical protein